MIMRGRRPYLADISHACARPKRKGQVALPAALCKTSGILQSSPMQPCHSPAELMMVQANISLCSIRGKAVHTEAGSYVATSCGIEKPGSAREP